MGDEMKHLLLLPGLSCDAQLWAGVTALLDGTGLITHVADLTQDESIAGMAQRALRAAPGEFALVGMSMGGYVALEVMRQTPERVTHLGLFDTSGRADDPERQQRRREGIALAQAGKFAQVVANALPGLLAPANVDGPIGAELRAMMLRVGAEAYGRQQQAILSRIDSRPSLGAITVPTLVAVGDLDTLTPRELSAELAAGIDGAELVAIPGAGHSTPMEAPAVVTGLIGALLHR